MSYHLRRSDGDSVHDYCLSDGYVCFLEPTYLYYDGFVSASYILKHHAHSDSLDHRSTSATYVPYTQHLTLSN